jgi:hypothetical protein
MTLFTRLLAGLFVAPGAMRFGPEAQNVQRVTEIPLTSR